MMSLTNQSLELKIVMYAVLNWHPREESNKSHACPVSAKSAAHQLKEQK